MPKYDGYMYIHICVCVCVCVCIYIYMYVCMYVYRMDWGWGEHEPDNTCMHTYRMQEWMNMTQIQRDALEAHWAEIEMARVNAWLKKQGMCVCV